MLPVREAWFKPWAYSQRDERRRRGADEQSCAPAAPAIRGIALFCNQVALTARRGQERGAVCDKRNSMAEYAFFEPIDPEELARFLVSAWCRFSCPKQAKIGHSRENCPRSKQLSRKMLTRKSFTGNHLRPDAARIPPSPPPRSAGFSPVENPPLCRSKTPRLFGCSA